VTSIVNGNRIFADIIKIRSYWTRVGFSLNLTSVPEGRREETQRHTRGESWGVTEQKLVQCVHKPRIAGRAERETWHGAMHP
jgi:hypothetical protein